MFNYLKAFTRSIRVPHFHSKSIRRVSSVVNGMEYHTDQNYYVWIDLELTGLDVNIHEIVEVACMVTNNKLDVLGDHLSLIIHQPQEIFEKGNEWSRDNHAKSGLTSESLNSKLSVTEADIILTNYVKTLTNYELNKGNYYLSGNSVHIDKKFLEKHMKNINEILHYRIIDVSTIKTLCSHWYPEKFNALPKKIVKHRAVSDIFQSINELRMYRENFFISC